MNVQQLEAIGDTLRSLGHHRREVVERIVAQAQKEGPKDARELYQQLDRISQEAIELMQQQRQLVAEELNILQ